MCGKVALHAVRFRIDPQRCASRDSSPLSRFRGGFTRPANGRFFPRIDRVYVSRGRSSAGHPNSIFEPCSTPCAPVRISSAPWRARLASRVITIRFSPMSHIRCHRRQRDRGSGHARPPDRTARSATAVSAPARSGPSQPGALPAASARACSRTPLPEAQLPYDVSLVRCRRSGHHLSDFFRLPAQPTRSHAGQRSHDLSSGVQQVAGHRPGAFLDDPGRKDALQMPGNSSEAPFADTVARGLCQALQDRGVKIREFLDGGVVP